MTQPLFTRAELKLHVFRLIEKASGAGEPQAAERYAFAAVNIASLLNIVTRDGGNPFDAQ